MRFRLADRRRGFDTIVNAGVVGGPRASLVVPRRCEPDLDESVCTDILEALLESAPSPSPAAWLLRRGTAEPTDLDRCWASAATRTFAIAGLPPPTLHALAREGWIDLRTGQRRTWRRLRLH